MHSANNPNPRDQKARTEIWLINLTMAATKLSLESYPIEQVGDSRSANQLRRNVVMHHEKENPQELEPLQLHLSNVLTPLDHMNKNTILMRPN